MRRVLSVLGLLVLTLFLSGCNHSFLALVGEHVASKHKDGATIGVLKALSDATAPRQRLNPSLVGEFRIEKVWNSSYAAHILGGVRFQNDTRFKWPYFFEATGGLSRLPGNSIFTLHPNLGFIIPRPGKPYDLFFRVGLPIYFFGGAPEVGTEFTFGFNFPMGQQRRK